MLLSKLKELVPRLETDLKKIADNEDYSAEKRSAKRIKKIGDAYAHATYQKPIDPYFERGPSAAAFVETLLCNRESLAVDVDCRAVPVIDSAQFEGRCFTLFSNLSLREATIKGER